MTITILNLLAMAIFSITGVEMTVRQGQAVTVNISGTVNETTTDSAIVANNPLYQGNGNSGQNPLYKN